MLMDQGKLAEAEAVVRKELEHAPESSQFLAFLCKILISTRRYAEAIKYADRIIRLVPRKAVGHRLKARALMLFHRNAKAAKALKKAIAVDPSNASIHRLLGQCHLNMGKPRMALKALNRSLELQNGSAWTWLLKADALWAQDRLNQAQSAYRKASSLNRDGTAWQAEALDRLATLLKANKKTAQARKVLQECKRRFPQFGCPYAQAALSPPDPTRPHRRETFVKPPRQRY